MQIGTIKQWNADKGYGFIKPQVSGKDVFFHISAWQGLQAPQQGQTVYYHAQQQADGRFAAIAVNTEPTLNTNAPAKLSPMAKWFNTALIAILLIIAAIFGIDFFTLSSAERAAQQAQAFSSHSQIAAQDAELKNTLNLIKQGGPFPYPEHDGKIFYNREGLLPEKPQGYYHEYTVPSKGTHNRGKKRVITGGNPPEVYYYTEDHYESFRQLEKSP